MNKFTNWHKLLIGKVQNFLRMNNYETIWLSWIKGFIMGIILMMVLSGCYVYESSYTIPQHNCELMARGDVCLSDHRCCNKQDHSTQIYYHNDLPYWGFYNDYYYYYGVAHMYPWWYYYTIRPNYIYSVNTHVYITCNTGYYIGKPRGPKFSNNKGGNFKPNNTKTIKVNRTNRTNIYSPNVTHIDGKPTTYTPNRNTKVKTNINYTRPNNNTNKSNIRVNTNKKSNVKVKTNRKNTKTNTRKPK